ncbi:MAG: hypothetical protein NTV01_06320 [Bacteroidia bacterium]|nr:hypothetical protein [Bacteroidia bacterium]
MKNHRSEITLQQARQCLILQGAGEKVAFVTRFKDTAEWLRKIYPELKVICPDDTTIQGAEVKTVWFDEQEMLDKKGLTGLQ